MKKVLVTGAGGFVGRRCLERLADLDYEVHAVDLCEGAAPCRWHQADLLNPHRTEELLSAIQPSHLLHLAWCAEPGVYMRSPENLRWVCASLTLLEQFISHGGSRAVIAGSCAEYDWNCDGPFHEMDSSVSPNSLYGASKHALHLVASAYAREMGLSLAWGRLFFLYGPDEKPQRLAPSVINSLLRGQPTSCRHGQFRRDFLHVQDAAGALAALLDCDVTGPVNIASGRAVTLEDLVGHIADALGRRQLLEIRHEPGGRDEPETIFADASRLRDEVGWCPKFDLETGLQQTIRWWSERSETHDRHR